MDGYDYKVIKLIKTEHKILSILYLNYSWIFLNDKQVIKVNRILSEED